jgi:hypothetical protein
MFGRLQSGGAINKDEEARFIDAGPRPGDSPEVAQKKLQDQVAIFETKLKTIGLDRNELKELGFDTGLIAEQPAPQGLPSGLQPVEIDQAISQANQGGIPFVNQAQANDIPPSGLNPDQRRSRIQELRNKRGR